MILNSRFTDQVTAITTSGYLYTIRSIPDSLNCLNNFLTAYLDDLLIYSENKLGHE